jgi:phage gp46-like protein
VFWRPATPDTLNWVNDTASKALQWMIDDGEAASVTVDSQFNGKVKGQIDMTVLIVEPTGKRTPFTYAWKLEG